MRLNTRIRTPDGRVGTICYNHLDGAGGIWGEHWFAMPRGGFGGDLPEPEFLLRANAEELLRKVPRFRERFSDDLEIVSEWCVLDAPPEEGTDA